MPVESPKLAGSAGPARGALRVLHVVDSLNVGGTESQMVEIALRMHAQSKPVQVACLRKTGPLLPLLERAGIPVKEFSPKKTLLSASGIFQLFRLARWIRREQFDVVHAHDLWANLLGVPAAWLARAPRIIASRRDLGHLEWYTPRRRNILRWILGRADVIVANSAAVKDYLTGVEGLSADRIRVIHNAVDIDRIVAARACREAVFPSLAADARVVIHVANMHSDVKGHPDLIEAAQVVCARLPQTCFVLAGDGQMQPHYEQRVRELGLEANFRFLGPRSDVPELLASADIAVVASRAEGFPNAVLEALAAGLPVVATNAGGTAEIIEDGRTGLLVAMQNPAALAEALLNVLQDDALRRRLGEAGREMVQRRFRFDRLLEQLENLYSNASEGGTAPASRPAH